MYFDLLPDTVENIKRCSSSRPNAQDWTKFIDEGPVSAFYEVGGEFGKYMGTRFNAIYLSCPEHDGVDLVIWIETSERWIVLNSVDIAFKILARFGEHFKRISFGNDDGHLFFDPNMLKSISDKCTNLKCLDVRSSKTTGTIAWIESFGKQLKTLKIDFGINREIVLAVSLHCTHIRELTLWDVELEDLEDVNLW